MGTTLMAPVLHQREHQERPLPGPGAPQPLAGRPQLKTLLHVDDAAFVMQQIRLIPRGTNLALYERCSDI